MGFIIYNIKDMTIKEKLIVSINASVMRIIYRRRSRCEVCSTTAGVEVLG